MLGRMARWADRGTLPRSRVAIFSSNIGLCRRVEAIIDCQPDLEWLCAVRTVDSAIDMSQAGAVDVLLVDSASDPTWRLCLMLNRLFPETALVALFTGDAGSSVASAWAVLHGVRSIVEIDTQVGDLANIIRRTVAGDSDLSPWDRAADSSAATPPRSGKDVTPRSY